MPREYATILFAIVFAVGAITIIYMVCDAIRDLVSGYRNRKALRRRMREMKETAGRSHRHAAVVTEKGSQ